MALLFERFKIKEYDAYFEEIQPRLEKIFQTYLADEKQHYLIAIDEAVCNAVRYAKRPENLSITIEIAIHDEDVSTMISSPTRFWDIKSFWRRLRDLGESSTGKMEWGEYIGQDAICGRGIWLMLMACEFVIFDITTCKVTLLCRRPYTDNRITKKIGLLTQRLLLEQEGMVL